MTFPLVPLAVLPAAPAPCGPVIRQEHEPVRGDQDEDEEEQECYEPPHLGAHDNAILLSAARRKHEGRVLTFTPFDVVAGLRVALGVSR